MATVEEKQELVETLKGPKYYRIQISGYGGESTYMKISKQAHDFWQQVTEENGEEDLVQYMLNAEDGNFDDIQVTVPPEAMFMTDEDGDGRPWYDPVEEIDHTFGASLQSSWITVDEIDSDDYNAKHIADVINRQDIVELHDQLYEDHNIEIVSMSCCDEPDDTTYIAQMYSMEKGCFWESIIETTGKFDPKKLVICTVEFLNGEDTITEVHYDGAETDNQGGDTNGKGYTAAVWSH